MSVEEEVKAQAVQKQLKGLDVKYGNHLRKGLTPNMAKINGYSIIWHKYAYCFGEIGTVEVMMPNRGRASDDGIDGHYPIKKLRKLVT